MADHTPNKHIPHNHLDAMHDLDHAAATASEDIIRKVDDLKVKNLSDHEGLVRRCAEINNHLADCNDHYLQVSQYQLVFIGGSPLIRIRPDSSMNHLHSRKTSLAMISLEFDKKRANSLSAFYAAQKEYFELIEGMKETEVEIQRLLGSLIKDVEKDHTEMKNGEADHDEMQESERRFTSLQEKRVQMQESWLEWLEELS